MRFALSAYLLLLMVFVQKQCYALSPEILLQYANGLVERKEYKAAAEEYFRVLSYFPAKQDETSLIEAMLKLAEKSEDFNFSLRLAMQIENSNYSGENKCLARYYRGRSLYLLKQYRSALEVCSLSAECSPEVTAKGTYFRGLTQLRMRNWEAAKHSFEKLDISFAYLNHRDRALQTARHGPKIPFRSSGVATLLAFVFPGGGYFYSGSPKSGLAALGTVGLLSWGAITSFQKNNDGAGVVLSILGVGWHFGGVYGAGKAAQRHNEYLLDQHLEQLEIP